MFIACVQKIGQIKWFQRVFLLLNRGAEIYRINAHARDRMLSAERRDAWFLREKLKHINTDIQITEEQKDEIRKFWEPYSFAYHNDINTQINFYRTSGRFDPSYIGFGLQVHSLVRFWNNPTFSTFRNKNFSYLLFPFLKHPKNVLMNDYGMYLDEDFNLLSETEVVDYVLHLLERGSELILKPTLDSGSGTSIVFLNKNTTRDVVIASMKRMKVNFAFQEIIKNHSSFAEANPSSLNTLRVVTLIHHNQVKLVGAALRVGNSKRVDNWDAGGFICEVGTDGVCKDFAVNGQGERVTVHPNGFRFAGHKLYRADEAIQMAIKCHHRIPQQKYISWDLTVDDKGDIVFIEMNSPGGSELLQVLGINAYGNKDILKDILDEYLIEKFFYVKANFDWDYREFSDHVSLLKYRGGGMWSLFRTILMAKKCA